MSCLSVGRLYDFLDGALPPAEKEAVERHLAACPSCRRALENRKCLAEAARALPPFAVPEDFAAGILARLPALPATKVKKTRLWLGWSAAVTTTILAGFGLAAIFSGQGAPAFLQRMGAGFGTYLQGAFNVFAKGLKLLVTAGKIVGTISGQVLATLRSVADMVGPEARIVIAGGTLVILVSGAMLLRRRQILTEKSHHE